MEVNAEVEYKLKTSESLYDLTIILGHRLTWEPSFCVGYLDNRARRIQVNGA